MRRVRGARVVWTPAWRLLLDGPVRDRVLPSIRRRVGPAAAGLRRGRGSQKVDVGTRSRCEASTRHAFVFCAGVALALSAPRPGCDGDAVPKR